MSRSISRELERVVRNRAGHRCEYCHLPQTCTNFKLPIDHIIAIQHRGVTAADNLARCCGPCNRHKGPNVSGVDHGTGALIPLFNPRTQRWEEHFRWSSTLLMGLTDVGRTTVDVLAINAPDRITARVALIDSGDFPASFV
jgi:5-methylcytosine-specific restriction endonuclease McrA